MDEQKKFNKGGFAAGLAIGLCAALIIVFAYLWTWSIPEDPNGGETNVTGTPTPTTAANSGNNSNSGNTENIFSSITNEELLAKIAEINKLIDQGSLYGASDEEKANAVISGILSALNDNYAAYYTVSDMAAMMESTSGTYCGIGALVSQNRLTGEITIVRPFKDGPAYKAGMLKDDVIVSVDGISVDGMDLNEVVTYMKGEPQTTVKIVVKRDGKEIELVITRDKIEVPTVEYELLDGNVGYIQVTEFDDVTTDQFKKAISALEKQGMVALVIDLRDNPGGLVSTAVNMIDRVVPTGIAVYTQDKDGNKSYEYATTAAELKIPVAVLVNGNSASASEIFTGALRDYDKAIVVGTQTYGKGIVQVVTYLSDGSGLKFTISEYFTPKGTAVHGVGITPDIEVELDESLKGLSEIPKDKDNQLQAAVNALLEKLK